MDQYTREQQLLLDEIVNKGYEPEVFQEFIELEDPQRGSNLELWTYEELLAIIQKFQANRVFDENYLTQSQLQPQQEDPLQGFQIIDEQSLAQLAKESLEKIRITDKITVEPYSRTIKCKPLQYLILQDSELKFQWRTIEFLQKDYLLSYCGASYGMGSQADSTGCLSAQNDSFESIPRDYGFKYILYKLPVLPAIRCDDNTLIMGEQKTMIKLIKQFLAQIDQIPILRTSKTLIEFLSETNQKFHQNFYNTQIQPQVKQFDLKQKSLGQINLEFNINEFNKCNQYQKFVAQDMQIVEEITKSFESLENNLKGCYRDIKNLSNQLSTYYQQLLLQGAPAMQSYSNTILYVQNHINQFHDDVFSSAQLIKKTFQFYFSQLHNQRDKLSEFKSNLNESYNQFQNEYNQLNKKKEELYPLKDVSKWKVSDKSRIDFNQIYSNFSYAKQFMLPYETSLLQDRLDQFVFMVNSFTMQMDQFTLRQRSLLKEYMANYLKIRRELIDNELSTWSRADQEFTQFD